MADIKKKQFLKIILFLICFFFLMVGANKLYGFHDTSQNYEIWKGFYKEPKNSIDVVYVGASNVYAYWQPPFVWEEYGYTTYALTTSTMPVRAIRYLIEESRKRQPDALYVININSFKPIDTEPIHIHWAADNMPFSTTKIRMLNDLASHMDPESDFTLLDAYFPFLRFHSRWSQLTEDDYDFELKPYKGACLFPIYLTDSVDVSSSYGATDAVGDPLPECEEVLLELLDYLEQEHVNAFFAVVPQARSNTLISQYNAYAQIVEERGFPVLNMLDLQEETGIDPVRDFYNTKHINVHGSLKFCDYFGRYLKETYDFENSTKEVSEETAKSWDVAYESYRDIIKSYVLDFELAHAKRDYSLKAPEVSAKQISKKQAEITWSAVDGADEYYIYRKYINNKTQKHSAWVFRGKTDKNTLTYTDGAIKKKRSFYYIVVPARTEGNETFYGDFDYLGQAMEPLEE